MNKEFIPYEQALMLKKLGFNEPCFGYYDIHYNSLNQTHKGVLKFTKNIEHLESQSKMIYILGQNTLLAPLYQQAFRWFREKYNLDGSMSVDVWSKKTTSYRITGGIQGFIEANSYGALYDIDSNEYSSYEEAELECLKKLIQINKL